jgi:Uma2 family endonuclease
MATTLKLNPSDHGRRISLEEFLASHAEDAHHDDLIDGKLYVSLKPNPPQDWIEQWLVNKLRTFSLKHSAIINYVTNKARIFVPGRPEDTCPEPDLAAYTRYPLHRPIRLIRWEEVSPILVGEVLSEEDPDKDLVRNVELYLAVPSIREYWIAYGREDPEQPTLRVHRRHGKSWRILDYGYGQVYRTKLLPGFKLVADPRS